MKKLLIVILGMCMLFSLTGCFSSTDDGNKAKDTSGDSKTSFKIGETAVFDGVDYTVTKVKYSNGNDWDQPTSGKKYVIVTIKIDNESDSKISYNSFDWKMLNYQGQEDDEAFTIINTDTELSSGDLAAGGTKTGTMVFEEPKEGTTLKLLYYSDSLFDEESTFEIVVE